jgi:hypothetical protein
VPSQDILLVTASNSGCSPSSGFPNCHSLNCFPILLYPTVVYSLMLRSLPSNRPTCHRIQYRILKQWEITSYQNHSDLTLQMVTSFILYQYTNILQHLIPASVLILISETYRISNRNKNKRQNLYRCNQMQWRVSLHNTVTSYFG